LTNGRLGASWVPCERKKKKKTCPKEAGKALVVRKRQSAVGKPKRNPGRENQHPRLRGRKPGLKKVRKKKNSKKKKKSSSKSLNTNQRGGRDY